MKAYPPCASFALVHYVYTYTTHSRSVSLQVPISWASTFLPIRRQATKAALVIQNNYRNYRSRPGSASSRQQAVHQQAAHQAARKIQQFMRQSKIKLVSVRCT